MKYAHQSQNQSSRLKKKVSVSNAEEYIQNVYSNLVAKNNQSQIDAYYKVAGNGSKPRSFVTNNNSPSNAYLSKKQFSNLSGSKTNLSRQGIKPAEKKKHISRNGDLLSLSKLSSP